MRNSIARGAVRAWRSDRYSFGFATHPHFRADGTFVPLPPIPEALLERSFRRAVLDFLVGEGAFSEALRDRMHGWRYSGFSVHNQVRVAAD